jgi:hypothetical protein
MAEKKQAYQVDTIALPPLKLVLGELPEPDPGQRPGETRSGQAEVRSVVQKLIVHIKDKK